LLRYSKKAAEKSCHLFASTTQVGLTQALGRIRMSSLPKDNFGNWIKFLFGGLLFAVGSSKLYVFATTGQVFFHHLKSFPFDLDGSNAAAMYGLYFIVGALLLASGIKGLLSK
jgi:hypothetical protein